MYYKIKETDEALNDLSAKAIELSDLSGTKDTGNRLIDDYAKAVESLFFFPHGFRGISMEHRGYEIRIFPYNNYNIFFTVLEEKNHVIILRVLDQKQNWYRILRLQNVYHMNGIVV